MTTALEGGEWSAKRPSRTLPSWKTRYPFYRRLGGPQGRSGRAENLVPTGIRSRTNGRSTWDKSVLLPWTGIEPFGITQLLCRYFISFCLVLQADWALVKGGVYCYTASEFVWDIWQPTLQRGSDRWRNSITTPPPPISTQVSWYRQLHCTAPDKTKR